MIATSSLDQALEVIRGAVEDFEWPPVTGIDSPIRAVPSKGARPKQPNLAQLLEQATTQIKVPTNFTLHFGKLSQLSMGYHGATACGTVFADPVDNVDRLMWFVRRLLSQEVLGEATFRRGGDAPAAFRGCHWRCAGFPSWSPRTRRSRSSTSVPTSS